MRAFALLSCAASLAHGSLLSAPLTCGPEGPLYSVQLDGQPLLSGAPPLTVFAYGAVQSSWSLLEARNVSGSDSLGAYRGVQCTYALAAAPAAP